ncbi:hypothetical protein GGQ71_000122 [Rhizobium taibaishanense]|uniref:Uncharacterized protein n=1 Tax=Allorhizobium taibaishanense TaxID=887144 RepID=A0A7W6HIM1_9HYPH|nr:hypothetical protein [Allorhizobium taibaishanense]
MTGYMEQNFIYPVKFSTKKEENRRSFLALGGFRR